jgi:PKD repeat protein
MTNRVSSLDTGYLPGDLSLFPSMVDDYDSLYEARNNIETKLKQGLSFSGKYVILEDGSGFPSTGIICLGLPPGVPGTPELIYYGKKNGNTFSQLIRGYAGSLQNKWISGTAATLSVNAEHHNAVKDAIINIEKKVGLVDHPTSDSISGMVKELEAKYLTPKATFRAYPHSGPAPLNVRFQNFSSGDLVRYLWNFGDGSRSVEKNVNHTYQSEGVYTVTLNIITSTGGQGVATKTNYITVSESEREPFFYVVMEDTHKAAWSKDKAYELTGDKNKAQWFHFVDQTDGDITIRYWSFGDGSTPITVADPNQQEVRHQFEHAGVYEVVLLLVFADDSVKRVFLPDNLEVI